MRLRLSLLAPFPFRHSLATTVEEVEEDGDKFNLDTFSKQFHRQEDEI